MKPFHIRFFTKPLNLESIIILGAKLRRDRSFKIGETRHYPPYAITRQRGYLEVKL